MAGEGKITKDDLSVKDPFQYLTESAKVAQAQVDSLAKDLDLILPKTQAILNGKSNSVAEIQAQIKAMDVLIARQKEARQVEENLTKTERELAKARIEQIRIEQAREKSVDKFNQQLERNLKTEQKLIREQEKLNSAYNKVQVGLTSLANRYRELAIKKEMGETLSAKEEIRLGRLQALTLKYDQALKTVDAGMGRHQRNVGNYASGWNGLGNSINQLSREMPAFANSIQTGFMALSNNIPILFDELSKIKRVNAELIAQGQPTTSMWRQVGASVFSFQTLLSVGVTLLTIYGAKMVDAIKGTDDFSKGNEKAMYSSKKFTEALDSNLESISKEIAEIETLVEIAKKDTTSKEDKLKAIQKINAISPEYLGSITSETLNTDESTKAIERYVLSLKNKSIAQALISARQSEVNKLVKAELKAEELAMKSLQEKTTDYLFSASGLWDMINGKFTQGLAQDINPLAKANKDMENFEKSFSKIVDKYKLSFDDFFGSGATQKTKELTKAKAEHIDKIKQETYEFQKLNLEAKKYFGIMSPEKLSELLSLEDERAKRIANIAVMEAEIVLHKARILNDTNLIRQAEDALYIAKVKQLEVIEKIELKQTVGDPAKTEEIKKQTELAKEQLQVADDTTKATKDRKEALNETIKATEQLAQIATDYYKTKLQAQIDGYNNSLELVSRQMSIIEQKAIQGNSRAEESLKKQIALQEELNRRKLEAETKIAKLNLINSIVSTTGSIIQGFETGTEYEVGNYLKPNLSGVGIDDTLIRVHGKERIVNEDLSKQIVGRKTSDVVKNALAYEQMMRYPMAQTIDMSETNELLRKVANKPDINFELGEITQTTLDIVKKEVSGNKEISHIYRAKYKA